MQRHRGSGAGALAGQQRAFGFQTAGQRRLAARARGVDQRLVEQVALRIAAAEGAGVAAQVAQPLDRAPVIAGDVRDHGLGRRPPDRQQEAGVVVCARLRRTLRGIELFEQVRPAGTGEGHRRVQVVERIPAVPGAGAPALGDRHPALADIDAAQAQAPEQRAHVDQLQRQRRPVPVDRAVEQLQRRIDIVEAEVMQGQMPPVVHGEQPALLPAGLTGHPADAVIAPALHLQHVHDRVLRPGVARLQFDRPAAVALGVVKIAVLLQPERIHAEQRVIAGHVRRPGRQRPGDAIPQQALVAGEEVELLPELQRQQVVRMLEAQVFERARRQPPASGTPVPDRRQMPCLPGIGRQGPGLRQRLARQRHGPGVGADQKQPGTQRMRHRELRRGRDRRLGVAERVTTQAAQFAQRDFEGVEGLGTGAAERVTVQILHRHDENSGSRDGRVPARPVVKRDVRRAQRGRCRGRSPPAGCCWSWPASGGQQAFSRPAAAGAASARHRGPRSRARAAAAPAP